MRFNLNGMLNDLNCLSQYIESQLDAAEERARVGYSLTEEDHCLFSYAGVLEEFKDYLELEKEKLKSNRKNKRNSNNKQHSRRKHGKNIRRL